MVIYAEYLFAENFLTGGLILLLSGKIAGIKLKKSLLFLGSVLCGAYSFILFWDSLQPWISVALKILFSVAVVAIVFRSGKLRQLCRLLLIFYLVSFAMGGITIGAAYFLGTKGVTQNSVVYLDSITYIDVILGCILSYLTFSTFAGFVKSRLQREKTIADVQIEFGNKTTTVKGMVDTGNFLTDPISHKPVFIISFSAAQKILPDEIKFLLTRDESAIAIFERLMASKFADRTRLIPYKSIGNRNGCLIGIRPDKICIQHGNCNDRVEMPGGVVLAIYEGTFSGETSGENYSVLIHPSAMEGGIACNV